MWNQNQDPRQGWASRGKTAIPGGDRVPFIRQGHHVLALSEFKVIPTESDGPAPMARFVVLQTNNPAEMPVGSVCERQWHVNAPPKFKGDTGDGRWADLVNFGAALFGIGVGTDEERSKILGYLFDEAQFDQMNPTANRGRGAVVTCDAKYNPPRQSRRPGAAPGEMTKEFTSSVFSHVPQQTAETRAAMRAKVEQALANPPPPAPVQPSAQQAMAPNPAAGQGNPWGGGGQAQQPAPTQQPGNPWGAAPAAPPPQAPPPQGGSPFGFAPINAPGQAPAAHPPWGGPPSGPQPGGGGWGGGDIPF